MHDQSSFFLSAGDNIVGKPIIFLVLGLGVYLEKFIVVGYEKCICPCARLGVAEGLKRWSSPWNRP